MLDFFRRYQRYFFLVITVVIVISFSFFGTYNTIPAENIREQVAFVAIDGEEVKRSDLEEMVLFISTDADDKMAFGGMWGPNFLNDGVVRKDFLQTGMAEILINQYEPLVAKDLQARGEKERRFIPYAHPDASFLNVQAVWEYFAPEMKTNFMTIKKTSNGTSKDALSARIALYLGERRLPPPMLKQILRYQEKQNGWVTPDPKLDRIDLSLFGYHTLDDWFGPQFLRITAQFIINASKVAQKKGYEVTKDEALADLIRNAHISFQQNLKNPHLGVTSNGEYLNEQLRRMNMDQAMAVRVWRQVLLFRRLFQDIGQSVLIDPFSFETITTYGKESASGTLYQLPKDLHINDYDALQKFEIYSSLISKPNSRGNNPLMPPSEFLDAKEIEKKHPELVQKRYLLEISQIDKKNLQAKVPVKDSWKWQVEDKNWEILKKEFPELGIKKGSTPEERFESLDQLDARTRTRVDTFARMALLDEHPEWIKESLQKEEPKQYSVGLSIKGNTVPFKGLKNPKALMALLDAAELPGQEGDNRAKDAANSLLAYSDDNQQYYQIRLLERSRDLEILTFSEANKRAVLDGLVDQELEQYYLKNRAQHPETFQKADKSWKSFSEVKNNVADLYFAKLLMAIREDYVKSVAKDKKRELTTGDHAAPYRLYAYMKSELDRREKHLDEISHLDTKPDDASLQNNTRPPLSQQWEIEKKPYKIERSAEEKKLNPLEVFAMVLGSWTPVHVLPNGEMYFFHKTGNDSQGVSSEVAAKIDGARRLMSDDSQRAYMRQLVAEIKNKNAISLDYLNQRTEMLPDSSVQIEGDESKEG